MHVPETTAQVDGVFERPAHSEPLGLDRAPFRVGLRAGLPWSMACLAVDTGMLALAAIATAVGGTAAGIPSGSAAWTWGFGLIVVALLALRGLYSPAFRLHTIDALRRVVAATSVAAMSLLALAAVLDAGPTPTDEIVRLWAFASAYVVAGRTALYWSQTQARRSGEGLRPTLIVGAGTVGRLAARRLLDSPQLGLKPIGFLDKEPRPQPNSDVHLPVLGASWDLDAVVREHDVEQVIITFSTAPNDVLLRLVRRCHELGVGVAMVPRLYERMTTRMSVEHIGGLPLVTAHSADPHGWQFAVKYGIDCIAALVLVALLSPLLAAGAIATFLSLGRPIFFRQRRVGRDGVEFDMLKFRTMHGAPEERGEADAEWAKQQLSESDSNVAVEASIQDVRSPGGKLLRRLSIDELPQLFNVLLGHMSIVGPRPERVHYVREFERNIYRYGDRHRVKSGITGWAQANGLRGNTSLADRVEWDNYYIENFSLWLDAKIVLMTFAAVFAGLKTVDEPS